MGRKGVSKRKPNQNKPKPLSGGAAAGSVASVLQAAESQPVKTLDTGKAAPSARGGGKPSSDRKNKSRKG